MYTKVDEGCHLGLCGCSYATDFDSHNYGTQWLENHKDSTMTNEDLWCNRFIGQASFRNFSFGGSSNYAIYQQIKKALEYNCDYILVFWSNTNRFNAFWKDGHPSVVPKSKSEQDYRKKYFSPYFQKFFSYLLVMDAARLLDLHSVKYKFFLWKGQGFPWPEAKDYPNTSIFHPAQLDESLHSNTSPNHLNEKGQAVVNEELNLYL